MEASRPNSLEREKLYETERQKDHKQIQNYRRQRQDSEMELAYEEREMEKAAEWVRHQIAQNKLEREQRKQALLQQTKRQQQNNQLRLDESKFENELKENACKKACITCIYCTQQICKCVII